MSVPWVWKVPAEEEAGEGLLLSTSAYFEHDRRYHALTQASVVISLCLHGPLFASSASSVQGETQAWTAHHQVHQDEAACPSL